MHASAIACKDTGVNVCLTYSSVGQGRPSSISSSYGDRVVVILLQLSEREDYDIICYDVEGKVSVPTSSCLSSVEVSYRYQVTSTHWRRLQGMHMCIITFYYVLVPRILIKDAMHECCAGMPNNRVGDTCPGSRALPVNSYTS